MKEDVAVVVHGEAVTVDAQFMRRRQLFDLPDGDVGAGDTQKLRDANLKHTNSDALEVAMHFLIRVMCMQ